MEQFRTPIYFLEENCGNQIYIMRDDLIPFSFGGNKARKAFLFFDQIRKDGYDTVVTYGSSSSNHCRIIANLAFSEHIKCIIISTENADGFNRRMVTGLFGAEIRVCSVERVASTIDEVVSEQTCQGRKVFFIPGGGHGNLGTRAYDLAYDTIKDYCDLSGITFDLIFHASGTGTTQAGLICGKIRHKVDNTKIIGISIARKNPRGGQVVAQSVQDYLGRNPGDELIFEDRYICGGYGEYDMSICRTIQRMMSQHGLPLDPTYTGKAYTGMEYYLREHGIEGKTILFIHTGGTPIYFDWMRENEYFDFELRNEK